MTGSPGRDWQPTAPLDHLCQRARLLAGLRSFMADRGIMEVDLPLLAAAPVTEPQIECFVVDTGRATGYLQSSPEYGMKRLLAAGSGPIYQLGKVFRAGERGARHNPEFTLLEWYRPGFSLPELVVETAELVASVLGPRPLRQVSYHRLFQQHLQLDIHRASEAELAAVADRLLDLHFTQASRDEWLHLLFATQIEPRLGREEFTAVMEFPASQAALARLVEDEHGVPVAARFELFVDGVELANGYHELTDAGEQRRRFEEDLAVRRRGGQSLPPIDERLLAALSAGLPDSCGVALGVDRLLMLKLGVERIDQVLAFPLERA